MPHLVRALPLNPVQPISIVQCLKMVQAAHHYLVDCGNSILQQTNLLERYTDWGSTFKRIRVGLPQDNRPELIDKALTDHNLIEICNQCATIERLMDALHWVHTHMSNYQVVRCHPTTSSLKYEIDSVVPNNDLVLIDEHGNYARFEVSDVVGTGDSNRKEEKDLMSLGVLKADTNQEEIDTRLNGRLFLVTSAEFADRLRKRGYPSKSPHYHYAEVKADGLTRIFEVLPTDR
jgi:hypothetical protein